LVSAIISSLLYGNIGIKVFYATVLRDIFHFPPLDEKLGKRIWIVCGMYHTRRRLRTQGTDVPPVPLYWILAMIVAGAVPQIAYLISFIGAACIIQFSYTFPAILTVGFNCQKDAILPDEEFDPTTGPVRNDHGWKRWMRGYRKQGWTNTFNLLYFLCALVTAALGIYASIVGMRDTFAVTRIAPFSCESPA